MTAKHTPTPWKASNGTIYAFNLSEYCVIATTDGSTFMPAMWKADQDELEANAAHIVRCVNERDELVALIAKGLSILEGFAPYERKDEIEFVDRSRAILAKIKES